MKDADWRNELGSMLGGNPPTGKREPVQRPDLERFIADVVLPAFEELTKELERHGRQVSVRSTPSSATLLVLSEGEEEITYRVEGRVFPGGIRPFADVRYRERKGLRLLRGESMFRSGPGDYTVRDVTREEVIRHFLDQYRRRVRAE